MLVNLTIRKGGIYFLGPNEDKASELRARTFLSVADSLDLTDISETAIGDKKKLIIVSLIGHGDPTTDEVLWAKDTPVNSGFINTSEKFAAGWRDQPGRLVLIVENKSAYRDFIHRYFETPQRWIKEQPPGTLDLITDAVRHRRAS